MRKHEVAEFGIECLEMMEEVELIMVLLKKSSGMAYQSGRNKLINLFTNMQSGAEIYKLPALNGHLNGLINELRTMTVKMNYDAHIINKGVYELNRVFSLAKQIKEG